VQGETAFIFLSYSVIDSASMAVGPFLWLVLWSGTLSLTNYVTWSLEKTPAVVLWKRFSFRHTSAFSALGELSGCALQINNLLTY